MDLYKISAGLASSGIAIIFILIAISFPNYVGFLGEDYNFFQHFISELGNPYKNSKFYLLNYGFMIIGFLFAPLMFTLGYHSKSEIGYLAGGIGVLAIIALIIVGYLPEHYLRKHTVAALTYFSCSSISVALFSLLCLFNDRMKKWLFLPSILPAILFLIFILYPKTELQNIIANPRTYVRPDIVWLAVLEWLFFVAMSFWVLCVSFFLWKIKK